MSIGGDLLGDLGQMQVHHCGVGARQHEGRRCLAGRAVGTKDGGPLAAAVARATGSRPPPGPYPGQRALLADAGLVLEPDFERPALCCFGDGRLIPQLAAAVSRSTPSNTKASASIRRAERASGALAEAARNSNALGSSRVIAIPDILASINDEESQPTQITKPPSQSIRRLVLGPRQLAECAPALQPLSDQDMIGSMYFTMKSAGLRSAKPLFPASRCASRTALVTPDPSASNHRSPVLWL